MRMRSPRAVKFDIVDMPFINLCPMAVLLLIAGCAGSMGTIHSEAPPPPVTAFDGSYRTTIRSTGSFATAQANSWCTSPGQPIVTVANGQFSYALPHPFVPDKPTPVFAATMANDGSFSGQIVSGTISGHVRGTHIEGRIDGSACIYAFDGERM